MKELTIFNAFKDILIMSLRSCSNKILHLFERLLPPPPPPPHTHTHLHLYMSMNVPFNILLVGHLQHNITIRQLFGHKIFQAIFSLATSKPGYYIGAKPPPRFLNFSCRRQDPPPPPPSSPRCIITFERPLSQNQIFCFSITQET